MMDVPGGTSNVRSRTRGVPSGLFSATLHATLPYQLKIFSNVADHCAALQHLLAESVSNSGLDEGSQAYKCQACVSGSIQQTDS